MRVLLVSIQSLHFNRWVGQLRDAGHDLHWFDVSDGEAVANLDFVTHHRGWRYKVKNRRFRQGIKRYLPTVAHKLEEDMQAAFEGVLNEVRPEVVHSFVLYKSAVPIFEVMRKHTHIKWVYSSWGSDLYHFQHIEPYRADMQRVLPHINYLFTDTLRDKGLAENHGFKGHYLGCFPGGGGFHLDQLEPYIQPVNNRNVILVKGYQGRSGRALAVLQAFTQLEIPNRLSLAVFGADPEVESFLKDNPSLYERCTLIRTKKDMMPHRELLQLMGKSLIYIGNSASDGIPNTLLEAIIMGAFPIQSNPGNATAEIIDHGKNGL